MQLLDRSELYVLPGKPERHTHHRRHAFLQRELAESRDVADRLHSHAHLLASQFWLDVYNGQDPGDAMAALKRGWSAFVRSPHLPAAGGIGWEDDPSADAPAPAAVELPAGFDPETIGPIIAEIEHILLRQSTDTIPAGSDPGRSPAGPSPAEPAPIMTSVDFDRMLARRREEGLSPPPPPAPSAEDLARDELETHAQLALMAGRATPPARRPARPVPPRRIRNVGDFGE